MFHQLRRFADQRINVQGRYKILAAVIVSTFFIGFGGGIVFPILPNLGVILGISPLMVGVILSANRVSRLLLNAPAGILVDCIGTRTPFVAGMFIQGVATSGYVVAMLVPPPEVWFLLARVLWGVGSALVFATAYTIASDVSDDSSRGTSMGMIRGGVLFGAPTGLVVGGIVSELAGTVVAFLLATGFALFATLVAYLLVPETHVEQEQKRTSVKPWDIDTSTAALTTGAINFTLMFVYFGVVFATLVLFVGDHELGVLGLDAQGTSGVFMALTVVTAGVFMFVGGYVSDRHQSRVPTLLCFLVLTCAGFAVLTATDSIAMLTVACLLLGAGQGGASGPLLALLGDLTASERMGRAVGTNNVLGDIGGAMGPVVALPMVDVVGFQPVYLASAAVPLVAVAILFAGVYRETGRFTPGVERSGR